MAGRVAFIIQAILLGHADRGFYRSSNESAELSRVTCTRRTHGYGTRSKVFVTEITRVAA